MVKNIFRERFKKMGVSYDQMGTLMGYSKNTIYTWVNNPGRSGHGSIMSMGTALGFDEKEIMEFWKALKMEQAVKRLEKW